MKRFRIGPLYRFIYSVFLKAGARSDVANLTARGLVKTSAIGTDTHGVGLFPHYLKALEGGRINGSPDFRFERTSTSTGRFDADHTFGHAAGIEGMRKAMELAQDAGAGHVAVYNSSHNGAQSYYSLEAAGKGFIGLSFTHATALTNTPGSTRPFFGTNPLCIAVPVKGEEPFCFDSAPTPVTWNRIKRLKEEKKNAPPMSGADEVGMETNDPLKIKQLLPIGGYKGFGLSMMVDMFCGMLTGMPVGRDISNMYEDPISQRRYLGQFYSVFRIDVFQEPEQFKERMKKVLDDVRSEPKKKGVSEILVPGDPEKKAFAERKLHGIPVKETDYCKFMEISGKYGVIFPREV